MNQNVLDVLNIGAPTFSDIKISISELRELSNDKKSFDEMIVHLNHFIYNQMHFSRYFGFHKIENTDEYNLINDNMVYNFVNNLTIFTDEKNSLSYIKLDEKNFLLNICYSLNVNNICFEKGTLKDLRYDEIFNLLNKRLIVLKNIKTFEELKNYFPFIYEDYKKGEEIYNNLYRIENKYGKEMREKIYENYKRCGLRYSLNKFIEKQFLMYYRYVNNFEMYKEICKKYTYTTSKDEFNNSDYFSFIDLKKLQLLICYKYFKKADKSKLESDYQNAIFYIMPFLADNNQVNTKIVIDNMIVDYLYIKNEYQRICKTYKNIVPYNAKRSAYKNISKEKVLEIIKNEINLLVCDKVSVGPKLKRNYTNNKTHIIKNEKDISKLKELYERKIALLENNKYIEKFLTEKGYNGYIYFVYPNGNILRERYFINFKEFLLAEDEAMYKSNIEYFLDIHSDNKTSLISKPDDIVKRIYHTINFEKNAQKYIDLPYDFNDLTNTEKFITFVRKKEILRPTVNKKIY